MKTQIKKIVTTIVWIITITSSSMAQKIDIDSNKTIDVLTDFLNIKDKLITYKDTNLWICYDKKWETATIITNEEENFIIHYKGIITGKNYFDNYNPLYCKKIKKGYHFTIVMNEKWFFTIDDNGSGGFYIKNKDGNICVNGEQVSVMTPEEMQYFGNKLYKLLWLIRWIKQKSSCKYATGFFYIYNR